MVSKLMGGVLLSFFNSSCLESFSFKVTPDLRGCPRGKNSYARHFKKNTANYISLESLINVDVRKKYKVSVSSITEKKIANNHGNDHVSFN